MKPDVLADITARRDAMEDGPAKADINTLLSMLDAANARADAAEDDTKLPKMRMIPRTIPATS